MNTIAITLNGIPVSGRSGMSILELAQEVGVNIPTLCNDPYLRPVGACRICLVEEEKSGKLLASCVTPIAPGMIINTQSAAVIENRKIIVKLMLASHPESCLLCDKGNRCQLRKLAAELGIGYLDYYPMPHFTGTQEVNPFILRDLSKCILCSKCIRADHELVVVGALDYLHRGFDSIPATTFNGPLEASECTFCGTCVTMCPTGALFERGKRHIGTVITRTASICSYCGCGCNIFLETLEDRLISVSPNPANGPNGKTLCVKGHYGQDYIHHPDRLRKPLIRKNGTLQEAEWDEALDFVAEGLQGIHSAYGPESMAFLGSSKCSNEENYLFQKIARSVFETNNIDSGARLHSGASIDTIPFGAMTNPLQDIEGSDVILVIGSNPSASHPVAGYNIKRAARLNGASLLVVDPINTELASFATAWVPIQPGTDSIFLNGILRGLFASKVLDEEIEGKRTTGLSELMESLAPFDPQFTEKSTGCSHSLFEIILNFISGAKSLAIVYGHGITRQANGQDAIRAIMNLALLKGCLGKTGGGIYPLDKENNGQGAWDMGIAPNRLPGHRDLDDGEATQRLQRQWKRPIPGKPGITAVEMMRRAEAGSLKAMYIMGENPVRSFPDSPGVERALSALDFLVVQDLFFTETAHLAHAVLPACSFAEKDGTFTNIERRVQRIRKVIEPFGQSLPDWAILCRLATRLGYPVDYRSTEEIMEEISSLVPLYGGISYANLDRGAVFWPYQQNWAGHEGRLSAQSWGEKKAILAPARPTCSSCEKNEKGDYFILVRGSNLYHFLGGTRSIRSTRLMAIAPAGFVQMNPSDGRKLGLEEGDSVKVFNDKAQTLMTVKLSESLSRGILFCPWSDRSSSALISIATGGAEINACRVQIRKES